MKRGVSELGCLYEAKKKACGEAAELNERGVLPLLPLPCLRHPLRQHSLGRESGGELLLLLLKQRGEEEEKSAGLPPYTHGRETGNKRL